MTAPSQESSRQAALLADTLASKRRHAAANRRAHDAWPPRFHSILLVACTLVSAGFCALYISKPVVMTFENAEFPVVEPSTRPTGESAGNPAEPVPEPAPPAYEETNLRVQHVMNASVDDGDVSRIVLDVPVIYTSRLLRWTGEEAGQARALHARLVDFHEQSRLLRERGQSLLAEWNALIERSMPVADLRADSPSLPSNQQAAEPLVRSEELDTTEVIEIHPAGP